MSGVTEDRGSSGGVLVVWVFVFFVLVRLVPVLLLGYWLVAWLITGDIDVPR